ncbi:MULTISPECIES: non-heme iron oxygenase ferredoxin subunit [unclassified Luteococcus]|uniref:non-heme iron oxygenase ferredoxin subunit n=1 Tax=unclassified Luteococcus TaxID=2639923 RepID=UPI00313EF538
MPEPIKVANAGDIEDEEAIIVDGETNGTGEDIAVFFSDGNYYALNDVCTHETASLADGWIEGDEVECPLHSAKFCLSTGAAKCLPASIPAKTHKVEVRGDEIWLHPGTPVEGAALAAE